MSALQFHNFPHDINDEPSEDWTVEQVMQWSLLISHKETATNYEEIVNKLRQQFEQGKENLLTLTNQKRDYESKDSENNKIFANDSKSKNYCSDKTTSAASLQQKGQEPSTNDKPESVYSSELIKNGGTISNPTEIHIDIISGHYSGKSFILKPKKRMPCWVGRSQGRKFKDRGISLPKDLEVSTTHGKFEVISNKLYFTDTGSTNGSKINVDDENINPNAPVELYRNLKLVLGQSILNINELK